LLETEEKDTNSLTSINSFQLKMYAASVGCLLNVRSEVKAGWLWLLSYSFLSTGGNNNNNNSSHQADTKANQHQ
jgi:hypothetical protein